jgi:hypothetical protein
MYSDLQTNNVYTDLNMDQQVKKSPTYRQDHKKSLCT